MQLQFFIQHRPCHVVISISYPSNKFSYGEKQDNFFSNNSKPAQRPARKIISPTRKIIRPHCFTVNHAEAWSYPSSWFKSLYAASSTLFVSQSGTYVTYVRTIFLTYVRLYARTVPQRIVLYHPCART